MLRSNEKSDAHYLQLSAINQSRTLERPSHPISLKSFYGDESDSDMSFPGRYTKPRSIAGDYPVDSRGKYCVPNTYGTSATGKRFRKKIKKIADREQKIINDSLASDDVVETPRGMFRSAKEKNDANLTKLVESTLDMKNKSIRGISLAAMTKQLKAARMKLFATRTAIEVQPKLIEKLKLGTSTKKRAIVNDDSPGVYSLHASLLLTQNRTDSDTAIAQSNNIVHTVTDAEMKILINKCRGDSTLNQHLLYNPKYDKKWKYRYTDLFLNSRKEKRPDNSQGWVLPLKRICEQTGVPSRFFTDNRSITLAEARAQVLYMRLLAEHETSSWLLEHDDSAFSNSSLIDYMNQHFDADGFQHRMNLYVDFIRSDVDKVSTGKFYNNIMLGKRMFGPAKKQMFGSSIIGGMERRFEILDNQVNHIPFTHNASDKNKEKCRNPSVHCRDSTRVILSYPFGENDFIHANRVSGGPLFNEFIITQAPMENTIGDFWRMVWQEKVLYIFMLVSRKESDKCVRYWPRTINSAPLTCYGLVIRNMGVNTSSDPLFQITSIQITGPDGEEHRLEHWQGNMNNSSNMVSPLNLLRLARDCSRPVIVHDCLGVSRAACLVAVEIALCSLIKGPSYKHLIQQCVQFLRSQRSFSIETPMQYIFIHRCVQYMFRNLGMVVKGMDKDYQKWLKQRASRMFVDDLNAPIPGYRLLSPKIDPDLLRQVRRPPRPNYRREAPDCVGEWPLPLDDNARRRLF